MTQSTWFAICLGILTGNLVFASSVHAELPTISSQVTSNTQSSVLFNRLFVTYIPELSYDRDRDDNDDDFNSRGYGRNYTYSIYQPKGQVEVVAERDDRDRLIIVERETIRGRKLKQRGRAVSAYQVIGLPSRVFPGLVGVRQIPPELVQSWGGRREEGGGRREE
ncbi:MAG: hypothetical protein HC866_22410 [Leptolyngbyaceae cyanobacterium RU_5_1]|nr:hypothetical protein [Leptolyngbyaceae cyanobacterium RU_5_1]